MCSRRIDAGKLEHGADVDAAVLVNAGLMRRAHDGVRLLGGGELKAKVNFSVYGASKSAIAAVEKAGGSVKIIAPPKEAKEPRGKNALRVIAEARGEKPAANPQRSPRTRVARPPAAKAKAPKPAPSKADQPKAEKSEKPKSEKPAADKPKAEKPKAEKPAAKSDKKPKA